MSKRHCRSCLYYEDEHCHYYPGKPDKVSPDRIECIRHAYYHNWQAIKEDVAPTQPEAPKSNEQEWPNP